MPAPDLTRRSFLALAGGAVLLASCGGGGGDGGGDGEPAELSPGVLSSDLFAHPRPQRLAFAMLAREGFESGRPARVALTPPGGLPRDFADTTLHREGLPDRRGVYVVETVLAEAGTWRGTVDYGGTRTDFVFAVGEEPIAPAPGDRAPRAASPTVAAPLGTDPLCTRNPACPLHEQSLADLVGSGTPVAVLFATPARCASQYCGPVLDLLLPLVEDSRGRVEVVHVEIYRDAHSDRLVPTVDAWRLPSEPFLFGLDGGGRVVARLDGAFDTEEIRSLLDALV